MGGTMGNRQWYNHEVEITVPDEGTLEIVIRVKTKWGSPSRFLH